MTLNDDFSFIRFLKVIKALYDHSTFTQLGRTVGTVLSNKSPKALAQFDDESLDDDLLSDAGSLVTADRAYRAKRGSFLADVLAACHSPNPGIGLVVSQNLTDMSDFESTVGSKRSALAKNVGLELELSSIFHHMLQCNAEILSDDETTDGRPSKDDDSFGDDSDDGATSCGEETLSQASPYRQARAGVV